MLEEEIEPMQSPQKSFDNEKTNNPANIIGE